MKLLAAVFIAASVFAEDTTDLKLVEQIAVELTAAAPAARLDDAAAYASASSKLRDSKLFESVSNPTILWGGHTPGKPLDPAENMLTEFDSRVWRVEYLPEFTFGGGHTVKRAEAYTVLALDCNFRNAMDPGDYPYPFWHSFRKWRSYQLATQVLLLFQSGKLIAGYRSDEEDPARPTVTRHFDGIWQWSGKDNAPEPHVSLYANLFSKENPYVKDLEQAYRELDRASRKANCVSCHSPDNKAESKRLVMLNYPNQALAARRTLVKQLQDDLMPPPDKQKGTPGGIADPVEKAGLVESAKAFTEAAGRALEFEKKRVQGN